MAFKEKRSEVQVPDEFVRVFREALERNKMTVVQVAAKVGVSQSYLSRLLSQDRGLPSDDALMEMAEVLKISPPEYLVIAAGRLPSIRSPKATDAAKIDVMMKTIKSFTDDPERIKRIALKDSLRFRVFMMIVYLMGLFLMEGREDERNEPTKG